MNKMKIKLNKDVFINKDVLLYIFLLVPFLEIDSLWFYIGSRLHYSLALICLGIINILLLFKYRRIYFDKFVLCFILYEGISILSALIHGSLNGGILYSIVLLYTVIQLLHFEFDKVLKSFSTIFIIIILLDFVSVPFFHEARIINEQTLLQNRFTAFTGGRNSLAPTLVPMTSIVIFYWFLKSNKRNLRMVAIILICTMTVIMGKSATGIVVVLFGVLLCFLFPVLKMNTKVYLWAYLGAFVLLVVFTNLLIGNEGIQWILEKVGRSTDLSLRPVIWDNAFTVIWQNILIGTGRGSGFSVVISEVLRYDNFLETHNMFIQLLKDDGVLGLLFYINMIVYAFKQIDAKHYFGDRILVIGLICFLINGLMESLQSKIIFFILLGIANEYSRRKHGTKIEGGDYCFDSYL